MDRELLLEIGVEELPASWLPGLTAQLTSKLQARLTEAGLPIKLPIEGHSTPRRLTVRWLGSKKTPLKIGLLMISYEGK